MAQKTLAERKFNERRKAGLADRDFTAVDLAFSRYGAYLELIGHDQPVGEVRAFQFPPAEMSLPTLMALMAEPSPFVEAD